MEKLQFKTNIKCSGCIDTVTPHLNALTGVQQWEVDTANPDKILTLLVDGTKASQIKETVHQAGFQAEKL